MNTHTHARTHTHLIGMHAVCPIARLTLSTTKRESTIVKTFVAVSTTDATNPGRPIAQKIASE